MVESVLYWLPNYVSFFSTIAFGIILSIIVYKTLNFIKAKILVERHKDGLSIL